MKKLGSLKGWEESIRYDYNITGVVLDIGSHNGKFAKEFRKKGCIVQEFDKHTSLAWTYDGVLELSDEGVSSTYLNEGEAYPCEDILKYLNTTIALCKINIEGGEYDLMEYILNSGLQGNVQNFQIQFHRIPKIRYKSRYENIAKKLLKTHSITWRQPFVWENWRLNP